MYDQEHDGDLDALLDVEEHDRQADGDSDLGEHSQQDGVLVLVADE